MATASLLKYAYLAHLSKPVGLRWLYRQIRRCQPARIVELGVGDGERTHRLLEVAGRYASEPLHYTGIDLFEGRVFEGRAEGAHISLKEAHRRFKPLAAKVRLQPGDPYTALSVLANSLSETDLIVISADQDAAALDRAWFYLPRMLHANSLVIREKRTGEGEVNLETVPRLELETLARGRQHRRAA